MIPRDLLPWDAAYRWHRHWRCDGTWDRVHNTLRNLVRAADGRDPEPTAAVLDAQSIASGEGGQARWFNMAKRTRGRKRHLVLDTHGLVLVVMVTSAAVQHRPGGRAILARLAAAFPTVGLVWADGGYANRVDNSLLLACLDVLPSTAPPPTLTRMENERALSISFIYPAQTWRQLAAVFGEHQARALFGLTNVLVMFGGSKR